MIRKIFSLLDNVRLKKKLFISYIVVAFVPIVIVGVYLTEQFRNHVLEQATEQSYNNVERIKTQLEDVVQRPIDISGVLMSDTDLSKITNTQFASTYEVVEAYQNYRSFRDYINLYSEIYNIRFYMDNPTLLNNWEFIQITKDISTSAWYNYTDQSGLIYWGYIPDETKKNESFVSLVRKVEFPLYRSKGVLVMNINPAALQNIVRQETFDTYIIDSSNIIVAAKNQQFVGKQLSELDFSVGRSDWEIGQYEIEVDGHPSRIIVEELKPQYSQNGFKIMSIFTIDSIVEGAERISVQGLLIILASLLLSMVLIYATSSLLSKRILSLVKNIHKLGTGDLTVTSTIAGNDEVGLLSRQFNNMVSSIRELMDRVRDTENQRNQLELRQGEIKLKMMASQINPHFLFNALESIRMHAHIKGDKELASIVRMLGKLIRKNLEVGSGSVKIADEVEVIRYYLAIQQFRFGQERLDFELHVDEAALETKLPPLLIQPIVENAVVHGMDQVLEEGKVTIKISLEEDKLQVVIADNGTGMDEARMQQVIEMMNQQDEVEGTRIGLRNVHQRLISIFGDEAGLHIASKPGEGTTVSFSVHMGGQTDV
ncbi:cache domain-containing sensor histidine kinase [Paenibacillus montaniterrae]|uniref:cache domain-containing sensor histidine kinase n=1 Tax=Paenibacillus montaniterrae TaxID=429341 RepID=UPI001FE25B9E|nr:sensor histidine kinase [Paenibacillus montaniterrae]